MQGLSYAVSTEYCPIPEPLKVVRHSDILKVIAVVSMLIDHIGAEILPQYPLLRVIGRLAFPLFAYQLAQGYVHTSNLKRYLNRLFIFALIAQVPYSLYFRTYRFNIMIPLLLSLLLIHQIRKRRWYLIIPILDAPFFFDMDYGWYGILLPMGFYFARKSKLAMLGITSLMTAIYCWQYHTWIQAFAMVGVLIALFFPMNTVRIRLNKYVFYWFYPVHILLLYFAKALIFH